MHGSVLKGRDKMKYILTLAFGFFIIFQSGPLASWVNHPILPFCSHYTHHHNASFPPEGTKPILSWYMFLFFSLGTRDCLFNRLNASSTP